MTEHRRESISQDETVLDPELIDGERPLPGFSLESLVDQVLDERYAVDQFVGMGAMGAVFRARQLRLRRTVALKVPKPTLCMEDEFLRRFEREALTMAKVVHQNIVQIFDVYVSSDHAKPSFIAMEYVEGTQLDRFLQTQKETLTVSGVIGLFRQIADGIDAAHRHGIVHRDIKPSNILVTMPQRVAKIMDFGIAQIEMEDAYQTTEGAGMMGTPAFMAPEQITGKEITPATDVYALGMVLYRLLSGKAPWTTKNTHELLLAKINTEPAPVTQRNPALPDELDDVLTRALSLDPESRQQSMVELVEEVAQALEPLKNLAYGDLFDADATQTAMVRMSQSLEHDRPGKMPAVAILAVAGAIVAIVAVIGLSGRGDAPDDSKAATAIAGVPVFEDRPAITPTPTPEGTAEPEATPAGAIAVVAEPTPTPLPTPTPPPMEPPRATPSPAPNETPVAEAPAAAPSPWDAAANPPSISRFRRAAVIDELESWIADEIRTPVFRRQFGTDRNALARIGEGTARDLLAKIQSLGGANDQVSLYLGIRDDATVWDDRAILRLEATIKGRPKTHPDPNYRATLWSGTEPLEARFELDAERKWKLAGLTGPVD